MRFKSLAACGLLLATALAASLASVARAQESLTLKKIAETGVITIGYRVGSMPFSHLDETLKPVGYSMDLCDRIVAAIATKISPRNLSVKRIAVTTATRIPLVANGTVDLECGVTTNTVDRQKSESFAITTFVAQSRLLAKKSANIRSLADLKGKAIVSTVGTTSIRYLTEVNRTRNLDMKILAGKDDAESFQMVEANRALAYAMDDVLLYGLVASAKNPADFAISEEALSVEPYGIALTKDDPAFKALVDAVIIDIFRRGEIHAIYRKWFLSPIPPKGINLQLPMSAALKRVIATPIDSGDPKRYE